MILTYRFRLKDRHAAELNRQARAVNYVWNYLNETQQKAARSGRKWLSDAELQRLTSGSAIMLDISANTISRVCRQYVRSRKQHNKPWLRFRGRKTLGWVPFQSDRLRFDGSAFVWRKLRYLPMHLREMPVGMIMHDGSFNQDSAGHWYINIAVEVTEALRNDTPCPVGVDLGLSTLATLSDASVVENPRHFRRLEVAYGDARRAHKKRLARKIATRIANARRDHLHKASARIALDHDLIFVGNVSSSKLSQTKFAKSVRDAGWSLFKDMLSYKAIRHGGRMIEVDEAMTSQTCSSCGQLPPERPRGTAGLGIREFSCTCGAVIDRDVNAALNILARGLASLAEGAA